MEDKLKEVELTKEELAEVTGGGGLHILKASMQCKKEGKEWRDGKCQNA